MSIREVAEQIVRDETNRPATAYRRLVDMITSGREITLNDRDLNVAALEALERGEALTVRAALRELDLRLAADEPVREAA